MNKNLSKIESVNMGTGEQRDVTSPQLKEALDTITDAAGVYFGSIKLFIHRGKPSPRVEIQKQLYKEIEE